MSDGNLILHNLRFITAHFSFFIALFVESWLCPLWSKQWCVVTMNTKVFGKPCSWSPFLIWEVNIGIFPCI